MFHRETSTVAGGGSSSHSTFSNVQNVSINTATFNVTQAKTVNQNRHPIYDPRCVLDWVSPINYRIIQNDTFSKHTTGTGRWFIEHPKFRAWLSGSIPVLCARGPPGVGKTILSSIAIRHLDSFSNNRDDIAFIFVYCRYTDQLSITDILASFVKQLVKRHPRFLSSVESVYRTHIVDETQPIEQDWLELLQTLIPSFNGAYIVIDALDEFPDNARDGLLNALVSLKASLLITSRLSNASHLLGEVEYIEIGNENEQDIEFFIHQRFKESSNLARLLREKEQVRRQICEKLMETSKSMFLVAALQIESLKNSTTVNQLRKSAHSLSSDIDDIYSTSWERIKAQSIEQAVLAEEAIIWLTHAYRPLKIFELQHALAVQCDGGTFDNDDVTDEETIASVCCGLITIDRESRIVRLVHSTALDFFKRLGHSLCSTPHTLISMRCLSYLSASKFSTYKISTRKELTDFLREEEYPLRDYAYRHWGSHAGRCYEEDGMPRAVSEFLLHGEHYPCIMEGGQFDLFERCHVAVYYGIMDSSVLSNEWWNHLTLLTKSTPLILACFGGNVDIVKLILSQNNASVNVQNKYEETPLIMASWNGHDAIIKLLLSQTNIAVNTQTEDGRTALMVASWNGHAAVVQLLLSQINIDINIQTKQGVTALMMASLNGHDAVVKLLLSQRGIDVDTQAEGGFTALMMASVNGHVTVAKQLLCLPAIAVNTQTENGWTALISASWHGHVAVVKLLLSHWQTNIAVNTQTEDGRTALMVASWNGHAAVVQLLLSQINIDINIQTKQGVTALMDASLNGHDAVVKLLLSQRGLAVNTQAEGGFTALMMASVNGHVTVVKQLLYLPAIAINTQTEGGWTALISASRHGHVAVVKLLLCQATIAVNTQTGDGWTALMMASKNGHYAVAELLLSQTNIDINKQTRQGVTALMMASKNGHDAVVELLLSQTNIAVNTQTEDGRTALMMASKNGHDAVVELLSQTNIAVNTQTEDGRTALILASQNGHDAVVELLLSHTDIAVNPQTEEGRTALMMASKNGHDAVVELLLSQTNIAVNTQTEDGRTALILASQNGHDAVVELLLSHTDIAVNTQTEDGQTALILASQNGHDAIVELLLSQTDVAVNTQDEDGSTALMMTS